MSATLTFGTYTHGDNPRVGISRRARLSAAGVLIETGEQWIIEGMLVAEDEGDPAADLTQDLTDKMAALETAYRQRNVDLTLTVNGVIHNRLRHSDTIGGIRVVAPPSYENGSGAEAITHRTYTIAVEADVKPTTGAGASDSFIVEWEETLEMFGGRPEVDFTKPLSGIPVRTTIRRSTPYFAVQSGFCVMRGRYFNPVSIFSSALLMESPRITKTSPILRGGNTYRDYRTDWQYVFGSSSALIGEPAKQPPQ